MRIFLRSLLLPALFAAHYCALAADASAKYRPQEGDILFQSLPQSDIVDAIEGITRSPYSHCGVVLKQDNEWVVIEAGAEVCETPLILWVARGRDAGYAVYRLKPPYAATIPEFKKNLRSYLGISYDSDYEMSDAKIYCSELIYKAFRKTTGEEMGALEKLGDLNWKPYEQFIKSVQDNKLPLDRAMITPQSLSAGKQMELIYSTGIRPTSAASPANRKPASP